MQADELTRLGNNVRKHRKALDMSQEDLAEICDLHRTYICDIERGARNVTVGTVLRLAKGLKTTVSDLTHGLEGDLNAIDGSGSIAGFSKGYLIDNQHPNGAPRFPSKRHNPHPPGHQGP